MKSCIPEEIMNVAWRGFTGRKWKEDINVRQFIQSNYTMYDGDRRPTSSGVVCRSCRRRSAPAAGCWNVKPRSFLR